MMNQHFVGKAVKWLVLALFVAYYSPQIVVAAGRPSFVAKQVVVEIDPLSGATIGDINATYNTTTLGQLSLAPIYLLQTPAGTTPQTIVKQMRLDSRLLYGELNYIGQPAEADPSSIWAWGGGDPAPYYDQYALDSLNLGSAHDDTTGSGVIVAVLDTGVQLVHPALSANLTVARYDFIDGDTIPDDVFDGIDEDRDGLVDEAAGHGTHVAGVILLVAPDAQIMPLRILNSDGLGNEFAVAQAIEFALNNGADVINLSLGMAIESQALKTTIKEATQEGASVFAAAGNLATSRKQFPAAGNCAMAIAAVGPAGIKSSFSNFGSWVFFVAPGESIYSTFPEDGYAWWSGTSMATPFLAGQAALLFSLDNSLNARQINILISGTAVSVDAQNPNYLGKLGSGQPDISASVAQLLSGVMPDPHGPVIGGSCVSGD